MKINTYLNHKIIHIFCENKNELIDMFLRPQEYYESPKFNNTIFTLGVYRKWYSEKFGAWTYYDDYCGFNLPCTTLVPFNEGLFDPLTEAEEKFINLFKDRKDKFYVIGTCQEYNAIEHELIHGTFFVDEKYQKQVLDVLQSEKDNLKKAFNWLKLKGYNKNQYLDEINAYISEGDTRITKLINKKLVTQLQELWEPYKKKFGELI